MKIDKKSEQWNDCIQHAYLNAVDCLLGWEYGGAMDESERLMQKHAAIEVASQLQKLALRKDVAFYKQKK